MDLNHPSRADLYSAQIAAEVRRSALGSKGQVSLLDLIIELKDKSQPKRMTEEERKRAIDMSKAAWLSRMLPPRKKLGTK